VFGHLRDAAVWLDAAAGAPVQALTLQYWVIHHRFSRDRDGRLTRLDVTIRPQRALRRLDQFPDRYLTELSSAVAALAPLALTHFDARIEIAGDLVPVPGLKSPKLR
jgi:hypothetical protein